MTKKQNSTESTQTHVEDDGLRGLAEPTRTLMFYDGGFPLCSCEVSHYQRLDRERRIEWINIHDNPSPVDLIGVKYEEAMAHLHVRNGAGKVQTGVFAAVWDALPYYHWLARILRSLRLLAALDLAYTRFARPGGRLG